MLQIQRHPIVNFINLVNAFTAHVTELAQDWVTIGGVVLIIHIPITGAFVGCLWLGVGTGGGGMSKAESKLNLSDEVKAELKKKRVRDLESGQSRRGSDVAMSRHYDKRDAHRYK